MRLAAAQVIAQKANDLLEQSEKRPVIRLSDVGVTSVKPLVQAMLLGMADQYQLHVSTGNRTVAQFKEVAELYGGACAHFVYGGCLPDETYDRIVKENPDPERLFHALIDAGYKTNWPDALEIESATSFYEFLTSLDVLSPRYWLIVYKRLGLPFYADSVPLDRIKFDPERVRQLVSNAPATATKPPERPKRGILGRIFEAVVLNTSILLPRDDAEKLARVCRSAASKAYHGAAKGVNPALFVSAVATTCERWAEDLERILGRTVSPTVAIRIRKQDLDYILPALNAEADEFELRAIESTALEKKGSFHARAAVRRFLIRKLQMQVPQARRNWKRTTDGAGGLYGGQSYKTKDDQYRAYQYAGEVVIGKKEFMEAFEKQVEEARHKLRTHPGRHQ